MSTPLDSQAREARNVRSLKRRTHAVLCLLPRALPANPLRALLGNYELASAHTWGSALTVARRRAFDLYLIYAPLGWADVNDLCRRIRTLDAHTPVIVYSAAPSALDRREARAAGCIQAYVARGDGAHNLAGTVGQLIMLTELRSMDALKRAAGAIESHVRALVPTGGPRRRIPGKRASLRLKVEACRLFAQAGGSRADFERLWPSLFERALRAQPERRRALLKRPR